MDTTAYDRGTLGDPSGQDTWNSPLWADPHTVGGVWADTPQTTTTPVVAAPPPPPRRGRTALVALSALLVAALIGVGIAKALPGGDSSVASPPAISASPTTPDPQAGNGATDPNTTDPGATDPGATDPNATDPGTGSGVLPGQGGLPGLLPGQGQSGDQGSSSGTAQGSTTLDPAAAKVAPGLVNITSTVGYDGGQAMGTGIVLTSDGVILTNHHVIAGSTSLKVAVAGTTTSYSADVLGYDASHDVAVIKLRGATGMTTAPLGDSTSVKIGDAVIGLGNAGGLNGSPIQAKGTVTGLGKSITATDAENGSAEQLSNLIETNAAIQPGDSGGALVSADGTVIGMVTAGSQATSGRQTTTTDGYAIPINDAMAIAQDIRDGKASSTIHLGASAFLGISVSSSATGSGSGVVIAGVVSGSAAQKAGITVGSTITEIDGVRVTTPTSLKAAISPHHPGDTVSVRWTDARGASHTQDVTFGSGPVG